MHRTSMITYRVYISERVKVPIPQETRLTETSDRPKVSPSPDLRCTRVMICGGPDPDPVCLKEAPTLSRNRCLLVDRPGARGRGPQEEEEARRGRKGIVGGERRPEREREEAESRVGNASRSADPITPRV
ncbi:hypothetical protein KM043_009785 [Ampulex compressa]|nr:hypothetical protein KM043_009785 [Ampulex compressa]